MARKSIHLDKKLLKEGVVRARQKGLYNISIRELCEQCKVNLGMFHYYFKTKDNFSKQVLHSIYINMMKDINIEVSKDFPPRKNIKIILKNINAFAYKNRVILSSLAGDVFSGNKKILDFIISNFSEHIFIILQELKRIKAYQRKEMRSLFNLVLVLVLPIVIPQIFCGLLERLNSGYPIKKNIPLLLVQTKEGINKRIEILLKGVLGDKK